MEKEKFDRVIKIIQHLEGFIDDSYYCEISEARACIKMLENEKKNLTK
jgi:hypothetical protein